MSTRRYRRTMPSRPDRIYLASDKTYRWPGESSSPRLGASRNSPGASAAALSTVKARHDGSENPEEVSDPILNRTTKTPTSVQKTEDQERQVQRLKSAPGGTGSDQNRVQKKHASSGRRQFFEFSRLGAVREGVDGRIEFKIYWKPTWGTLEDLQGTWALTEAKVLTRNEYGQARWDDEIESSGHVD